MDQYSYSPKSPGEINQDSQKEEEEQNLADQKLISIKKEARKSPVKETNPPPVDENTIKNRKLETFERNQIEKRNKNESGDVNREFKEQLNNFNLYQNAPWNHDRGIVTLMKNVYPLKFKLNHPQKSSLSLYEQRDFLNLHSKYKSRTHLVQGEVKNYRLYLVMSLI